MGNLSVKVHPLIPPWALASVLLALVLPVFSLGVLECHFCPMQLREKSCANVTTHCRPNQRCATSKGYYGPVHILSSQGCVDSRLCGAEETTLYRNVEYKVRHSCCCRDKCNETPKPESLLKKLVEMMRNTAEYKNVTQALREEMRDSCANYTSPSEA